MPDLIRRAVILIVVLGLMTLSALALAQPNQVGAVTQHTHQEPDTIFHFGYDEEGQVLVFGISDIEDAEDCTLEGEVVLTYGESSDGLIAVTNGGEDCELSGVEVTGPQGQVNHGMFMKAFNSVFEGTGRGCLIRHLAQSRLGMDEQQVRVPDADPDFETVQPDDIALVEFSSVLTKCQHGRGNGNGNGNGNGPPDHAAADNRGRPESPGKSAEAPGRSGEAGAAGAGGEQGKPESPGRSETAPGRNK